MKEFKKLALFTDIHFGAKGNSESHNQDCVNFVEWFIQTTKSEKADGVVFLGDWYENRKSINVLTMTYSEKALKLLNNMDIPVFFIIGNHDIFNRNDREIYSIGIVDTLDNITLINEPTVIANGKNDFLLVPYLFEHEYTDILKYNKVKIWFGHFAFNGFDLGGGQLSNGFTDIKAFSSPSLIVSGHFHKRDQIKNTVYMGSAFPTTFAASNDPNSGMAICTFTKKLKFIEWDDAPSYQRVNLSDVIDGTVTLNNNARVECMADVVVSYNESLELRKRFMDDSDLREFTLLETNEAQEALEGEDIDIPEELLSVGTDDFVKNMIKKIESDTLSIDKLSKLYEEL